MCVDKIAHEIRAQEWFSIIQTCNSSGLPKRQWCEEHGIRLRQFFYWQKKIRAELYKEAKEKKTELVPVSPRQSAAPASSFAEIPTTPIAVTQGDPFQPDAVIKVGNISIEIANTATSELLERIGSTLLNHAV